MVFLRESIIQLFYLAELLDMDLPTYRLACRSEVLLRSQKTQKSLEPFKSMFHEPSRASGRHWACQCGPARVSGCPVESPMSSWQIRISALPRNPQFMMLAGSLGHLSCACGVVMRARSQHWVQLGRDRQPLIWRPLGARKLEQLCLHVLRLRAFHTRH